MAIFRCKAALLLLLWTAAGFAADRYAPDWPKIQAETLEHYTALLKLDTSNPPGNESRAANYVKAVLDREGIPNQLLALDPNRANLVARLKGNGAKRPIIVMGHTDVVGVERARWSVDPFAAIRKGGFIYGRGAQDDKDNLTAGLMVMLMLKRLNVQLDRDVIFLAESGEEGTTSVGMDFLVKNHWPEIDAEFALAEGGGAVAENGKVRYVAVSTTEKVPRGVRLVAHGTAGHASRPTPDNPVIHLAAAVAKFGEWQPAMRLSETTRVYFERLAKVSSPADARRYRGILDPRRGPFIDAYFKEHEPAHFSILRTSITPTMLRAGFRSNVIPSDAEAYLDVRTLPDENLPKLWAELVRVIDDPAVEVIPPKRTGRPATPPSRLDTAMFRALEQAQQRLFPGAVTLPSMLTGATDMAQLRAHGVEAYGIGPVIDSADGDGGGAHGDDERLAEISLYKFVEYVWYAVRDVAAR